MESGPRRTGRAHEHELCPEFEHSALHHWAANHSWRALSTCSLADYEKNDGQCHARLWLTQLYVCWRRIMSFGFFSRHCSPLNATLHRSVLLRAPLQQRCKNRLSSKKSRDAARARARSITAINGRRTRAGRRVTHRANSRLPLRTASTTSRIASITSCGCSLCISWPLFVLVTCFSFGTSFASRSCAFFCAASTT